MLADTTPSHPLPSPEPWEAALALHRTGGELLDALSPVLLDDSGRPVVLEALRRLWGDLGDETLFTPLPVAEEGPVLDFLARRHWTCLSASGTGCLAADRTSALAIARTALLAPGAASCPPEGSGRLAGKDADARRAELQTILTHQGGLLVCLEDPCDESTGGRSDAATREQMLSILEDLAQQGPVTLLLDGRNWDYVPDPAALDEALRQHSEHARKGRIRLGAVVDFARSFGLHGLGGAALLFPWETDPAVQEALLAARQHHPRCPTPAAALLRRLRQDGKAQAHLADEQRHWSEVLGWRAHVLDQALRGEGLPGCVWGGGFLVALTLQEASRLALRLRQEGTFVETCPQGLRISLAGLPAGQIPAFVRHLREHL